ncbi:MAG: YqgE/AlgH family protein [Caulobacteraceae bacterium]|nr:YqgE/AlgH family protein [Caulobacteraceae bacterium]
MTSESPFLTGRLLIAMPTIGDPRFERAVVLVCAHTPEHAMGLTVNHPVEGLTVPSLLSRLGVKSEIELPEDLVLLGGPVESERGFVLHTDDYVCPNSSMSVGEGLSLTATREVLEAMVSHDNRPRHSVLALGYAGWGPGQLEHEIRENAWLVCDPDDSLLFGVDHRAKWSQALAKLGVSLDHLSGEAGRA